MEQNLKNKHVSYLKETVDIVSLLEKIKESNWVKPDMVIVNCFPEYSSRVCQIVNHKLSYLNSNELFEQIDLFMPYPNMTQVWNPCDRKYQGFYNYMTDWVRMNMLSTNTYLFLSAGENLVALRSFLKIKLEPDSYRLGSVYVKEGGNLPDFWVEKYNKVPLFEWQNTDNPNWK